MGARALAWLGALAGAVLVTGGGCSATRFDHDKCSDSGQCRQAFGFGSSCNAEGLCERAPAFARCATAVPEDLFTRAERYPNIVVVGSLMDRSSAAHVVREKAVRLAVREASEMGGLEGRPLGAVFCDIAEKTEYDPLKRGEAAVASARYLSSSLGVAAIVGPSASGDAQLVWSELRGMGPALISPAATSPSLLSLEPASSDEQPGLLWRVAPPDSLQGVVIAEDMLGRGIREVAVIREVTSYGEGLAQVFQKRFGEGGGSVAMETINSDTQIGEATAKVAGGTAKEVLFISSQQSWVVKFLNAASGQAAYQEKRIFLTDAAANQGVLTGASTAAGLFPRVRGTRPASRDARDYVYASFVANYKAQYQGEDPTAATFSDHSYDAGWLALYGSAWSLLQEQKVSGLGIARGLRRVSAGAATNIIPSSWPSVVNAFRNGMSVNLSGASGEIDFDPNERNVTAPVEIWNIVENGGQPSIARVEIRNPGPITK